VSLPAFNRPKESIAWAREAINELDVSFRDFFHPKPLGPIIKGRKPYGQVVDIDPETGDEVHKFKIFDAVPSALSRRATEALGNLRNSFDQSVFAACSAIGRIPKKGNLHFPWRTSPIDLNRTLENGPVTAEFWEVIKREEPYPTGNGYTGGDDTIREIAKLANGKHTVGLAITPRVSSYTHPSIFSSGNRVVIPGIRWDPVKNEMIMAIVSPGTDVKHDYKVQLQVGLDVAPPLRDIPAIALFNAFADRAESFTKAIEAECSKILRG